MVKKRFLPVSVLFMCVALIFALNATAGDQTPNEVLKKLQDGNNRYLNGDGKFPNLSQARRTETAVNGQHPYATVIACSDSRVPVELIFDAGIGDIFVIRVAGNVADVDEIGSIEYGIDHLETPVLVVLGHTHCGAVTAVVQNAQVHGSIPQLVDNIIPAVDRVKKDHPEMSGEAVIAEAVKQNVWQTIHDLLRNSAAARERVHNGSLKIVGAIYDIASGRVDWLEPFTDHEWILSGIKETTDQENHH